MANRFLRLVLLVIVSWAVMTFCHEIGHIIGGTCCGGTLVSADLLPWHLPYSMFDPDPFPLVTLWAGLLIGVLLPLGIALILGHEWSWFIANFCILANGAYVATAWVSGEPYLDTTKLLAHGANPIQILLYCLLTIGFGYTGFRRSCVTLLKTSSQV